jgi:PAP2 superfamily protein
MVSTVLNRCIRHTSAIVVLWGAAATVVPATARADDVTDWNRAMLRAGLIAGTSNLAMTRVAAMAQVAVFDAVNGIERRYTPVHVAPSGPAGASERAAAVEAAYVILSRTFGTQAVVPPAIPTAAQFAQQANLDARRIIFQQAILDSESAASIDAGTAWGQSVADEIWTWRATDGIQITTPVWTGSTTPGQWRPTPNAPVSETLFSGNGAGYPQFSNMTPWAILDKAQFRPGPPPAVTSAAYLDDLAEVQAMGSFSSPSRTADQTTYSLFFAAGSATYVWNNVADGLIEPAARDDGEHNKRSDGHRRQRDALLEHARILAELTVAMADAAIGCWDAKYVYNFWRPITAIREGTADTTWSPLFATPSHPDYPSGHLCASGAAGFVLAHEFGEPTRFTMSSDVLLDVTRSFRSFDDAVEEIKNARIFSGIHFRTATDVGQVLGQSVAEFILENKFQRLN